MLAIILTALALASLAAISAQLIAFARSNQK